MNGPFKVGDICVGQNFVQSPELNGQECQITHPLGRFLTRDRVSGEIAMLSVWGVQFSDGFNTHVEPHRLRLKRRPSDESWADAKVKTTINDALFVHLDELRKTVREHDKAMQREAK